MAAQKLGCRGRVNVGVGEGSTWGRKERTLAHKEILMVITRATVVANATKEMELRYV